MSVLLTRLEQSLSSREICMAAVESCEALTDEINELREGLDDIIGDIDAFLATTTPEEIGGFLDEIRDKRQEIISWRRQLSDVEFSSYIARNTGPSTRSRTRESLASTTTSESISSAPPRPVPPASTSTPKPRKRPMESSTTNDTKKRFWPKRKNN
ncbi:hypothetical protein BDN71DRAFT_1458876 [Pleurotus eryngii]|uniref:Uncharacterized protein n=1 Tax=Pleurotus eryngii TaxID=5323 RepID=A0A9P5ZF24_PLEER|nr:hypothetical protein BDN71DRAFT_1458876 [Pleurotus eryngii]